MSFGTFGLYFSVHVNEEPAVAWSFRLAGETPETEPFGGVFFSSEEDTSLTNAAQ